MSFEACNSTFSVLNDYAPNDKKRRNTFLQNISSFMFEKSQGIKIIGGDFNDINDAKDRISSSKKQPKRNDYLTKSKEYNNLTDIWREFNQYKQHFT